VRSATAIIAPEMWILCEGTEVEWTQKLTQWVGQRVFVVWQKELLTGEQLSEDKKRAQTS
jgi:hypothetical protein